MKNRLLTCSSSHLKNGESWQLTTENKAVSGFFMPKILHWTQLTRKKRPVRLGATNRTPLYEPRRRSVMQATSETGKQVTIAFGSRYERLIFELHHLVGSRRKLAADGGSYLLRGSRMLK